MENKKLQEELYLFLRRKGATGQSDLLGVFEEYPMLEVMENLIYLNRNGEVKKRKDGSKIIYEFAGKTDEKEAESFRSP